MSIRNNGSPIISICLIVIVLSGCSTEPVYLDSQFKTNKIRKKADITNSFHLLSIEDARRNKKSLGNVYCRNVRNENLLTWLKQGFEAIDIVSGDMEQSEQNIIDVEVSLMMLYVRTVEVAMCCNIVVQVRFSKDGNELKKSLYRGKNTKMVWTMGEEEIDGCFDRALTEMLKSIRKDMVEIEKM